MSPPLRASSLLLRSPAAHLARRSPIRSLYSASPLRPLWVPIPGGGCPGSQPVYAPLDVRWETRKLPGSAAHLSEDPRGGNHRVRASRITPGSCEDASSVQELQRHDPAGTDHDPGRPPDRLSVLGGGLGDLGGVIRGRNDIDVPLAGLLCVGADGQVRLVRTPGDRACIARVHVAYRAPSAALPCQSPSPVPPREPCALQCKHAPK